MREMPSLKLIPQRPVSGGLCLLALVTSIAYWGSGPGSIEAIEMHPAAFHGEPWRLIASALPHADFLHLAFNLYWTWVFGTLVEEVFGSLWTGAIVLFMAAGSSAAEYAVFEGGIGLSGVGYGLFGFLWVLGKRDVRFFDAVDRAVVQLFIVWFFVCIALTVSDLMPIANVAHGVGALIGICMAFAVSESDPLKRRGFIALNVVWLVGVTLAATVALPWVNLAGGGGRDLGWRGWLACEDNDSARAAQLIEQGIEEGPGGFRDSMLELRDTFEKYPDACGGASR